MLYRFTNSLLCTTVPAFCDVERPNDADGAAMYAIVTVSLFATAIGLFIAMLSFKKKQFDDWDRQGDWAY